MAESTTVPAVTKPETIILLNAHLKIGALAIKRWKLSSVTWVGNSSGGIFVIKSEGLKAVKNSQYKGSKDMPAQKIKTIQPRILPNLPKTLPVVFLNL